MENKAVTLDFDLKNKIFIFPTLGKFLVSNYLGLRDAQKIRKNL